MDFISLSPSDDDVFGESPHTQRQGLQLSEEAAISPPRRRPVPAGSVSSVITIPPGSFLLNLQNYSSSDDSSTSPGTPPPPAKRGRGISRASSRGTCSYPTPSPARIIPAPQLRSDAGVSTRSRSTRHHTPPRSPTSQLSSKISDWTVATLHKVLRERGIHFHSTDNKAKLFDILMAACCSRSCSSTGVLLGDVITHTAARREIRTPPKEVIYSQVQSSTTQTAWRRRKSAPTQSAGEREPDTGMVSLSPLQTQPTSLLQQRLLASGCQYTLQFSLSMPVQQHRVAPGCP
ncbi:serine/arginine repetitive matrix protein 1-like [Scomber scombrus]|uniref:Serine/arginine repetitive matrix protein 1-like n=1 Tax=Scomber scombrus TaxID=13677 RepID=A0AAV1Q1X3_SCOSC